MATVNPNIAKIVAHMPEIRAAVLLERDDLAHIAQTLFAPHDNPGGHEITTSVDDIDGLVNFDGPAPAAVEFGHWTPDRKTHVEGLHILGRAIAQAAL